jgi:hypothetical protein
LSSIEKAGGVSGAEGVCGAAVAGGAGLAGGVCCASNGDAQINNRKAASKSGVLRVIDGKSSRQNFLLSRPAAARVPESLEKKKRGQFI